MNMAVMVARRRVTTQSYLALCVFSFVAATGFLLLRAPPHLAFSVHLPHENGATEEPFAPGMHPVESGLPREVWAGGRKLSSNSTMATEVRSLLSNEDATRLMQLCGRCLYHSLTNVLVGHDMGYWVFVATGDIPDMWIRDSSVQLGIYLPRVAAHPALRRLIEGAIRTQAFLITQDPYANAYSSAWRSHSDLNKFERLLGRAGWVATRNYELDSGAYFINLMHNYFTTPGIHAPEQVLGEAVVLDAVHLMVDTWVVEQRHEEQSPYRYSELMREGLGAPTAYTGMTWSGFRPSDDPNTFGYSIPSNIYAAGALQRVLVLNNAVWHSPELGAKARRLLGHIEAGIAEHGVVEVEPGVDVYAYEVDGLGGALADFDDANIPSLLSIPLLGWEGYNRSVYEATRKRLLSPVHNKFYFAGDHFEGIGSPHTPARYVWPLALSIQALTSDSAADRARVLQTMLTLQCGNGLMHESVNVDNPGACTRPIFEWANAMLVALVENALGVDCDADAEAYRLHQVARREAADTSRRPTNHGADNPKYYESLESYVTFDGAFKGGATSFHHLKGVPDEKEVPRAATAADKVFAWKRESKGSSGSDSSSNGGGGGGSGGQAKTQQAEERLTEAIGILEKAAGSVT